MRRRILASIGGNSEEAMYKELYLSLSSFFASYQTSEEIVIDVAGKALKNSQGMNWLRLNGIRKVKIINLVSANLSYMFRNISAGTLEEFEIVGTSFYSNIAYAFAASSSIKSVTIRGYTGGSGGGSAFSGCTSLTDVYMPDCNKNDFGSSGAPAGVTFHFKDGDVVIE